MIEPSVGRKLWFHPHVDEGHKPGDQPHSAEIVHVLDWRTVNLAVFNSSGALYSRQAVQLLQDDDVPPETGHFAMWMPYQQGQAARTEAAQAAAQELQLAPVHEKIAALEQGVQGKFEALGDWLKQMFTTFEQRVAGLESRKAPPLAPQAEAPAPDAPDTAEAQRDGTASSEPAKAAEPVA